MSAVHSLLVATVTDVSLSLPEFLQTLKRRRQLAALVRQTLVEKMQVEMAQRDGLAVTDAELQQSADRFRYRHGLTTADAMNKWLANEHLSVEDFETGLEHDLLISKFQQHLTNPKLADHFAANQSRFAKAQLRQIVVATEDVARELLAQLTDEGRDFAELARNHSLHNPSRLAGGSLGAVPRWALPAKAGDAVFAAKAGDIIGPLAGEQGFVLFLVEALSPPALDDETAAVIRRELFDAWLRERLRDVRIDLSCLEKV